VLCHRVIIVSSKSQSDEACRATAYKPRTLSSLVRWEIFFIRVTFFSIQSCDALITDGAPCPTHPLAYLARHQSQIWIGFDTICHGFIILFLKSRSDEVCNVTTYKLYTPLSLIRCGIFLSKAVSRGCPMHESIGKHTRLKVFWFIYFGSEDLMNLKPVKSH